VAGLRLEINPTNLGFLKSCNRSALLAKGDYLFFLNNDTIVCEGWLEPMLTVFDRFPDAGLVGSKLLFPEGTLQEAGGIVWNDGSAWNYGRSDDPDKPEYNYVREADYISGCAILVPRALLELGPAVACAIYTQLSSFHEAVFRRDASAGVASTDSILSK
jgi:GT2 family glycosyltransferase